MPSVATTLRLNPKQVQIIDAIGDRLGMERLPCIRFLLQIGISTEQVRNAISDGAEATGALVNVMTSDLLQEAMEKSEEKGRVLVTPAQRDKNGTEGGKARRRRRHV